MIDTTLPLRRLEIGFFLKWSCIFCSDLFYPGRIPESFRIITHWSEAGKYYEPIQFQPLFAKAGITPELPEGVFISTGFLEYGSIKIGRIKKEVQV